MALTIKGLERVFTFQKNNKEVMLDDPNPAMTPDQVMSFYAVQYPELTTATVHGPEVKKDKAIYSLKTTIGTKG